MSEKPIPNACPAVYATMLPGLIEVARGHGYALAVHGSMLRDDGAESQRLEAGGAAGATEGHGGEQGDEFHHSDRGKG